MISKLFLTLRHKMNYNKVFSFKQFIQFYLLAILFHCNFKYCINILYDNSIHQIMHNFKNIYEAKLRYYKKSF